MTTRLLFIYTFPGIADEVGVARRLVRRAATVRLDVRQSDVGHPAVDDLELLTSEIVTNALCHVRSGAGGQIRLALLTTDLTFRVEVVDQGGAGAKPDVRGPAQDAERGRGLILVEALSKEWGVEPEGSGSKAWFEVPYF